MSGPRRHQSGPGRATAARLVLAAALVAALVPASSCSRSADLSQALEITETNGAWFDAGVAGGRNKIVPNVTFRLKKRAPVELTRVSVNALFRATDGKESELDNDVYVQRVDFQGDATAPITIRAENGYTADPPQSRADMLKHSQFRDMRVQILVKQGASQWKDLGWIDVKRHLVTQ